MTVGASPAAVSAQDSISLSLPESVPSDVFSGSRSKDVLIAQVLLDRSRFSPGVIDGVLGGNPRRAIEAVQRARGLPVDGLVPTAAIRLIRERGLYADSE